MKRKRTHSFPYTSSQRTIDVHDHLLPDLWGVVFDYAIETAEDIDDLFPDHQSRNNNTVLQKWVCRQMQDRFSISIYTPHCIESYLFNDEVKTLVDVFRKACEKGDMKFLLARQTIDRITIEDARSQNNYALRSAAINGDVKVLECLHKMYQLTAEDARSGNNYALRSAAENGRVEVLEWLHKTYKLTAEDARSQNNYALRSAAETGRVEVLECLHKTYQLTAEDARYWNNYALRLAAINGDVKVLECLHKTYQLTTEDARRY